jgi:D-amino-acid dehydrogenase
LAEEKSILITGAGIIGLACAHYLSRVGYQVTVIDQGAIAGACSHGNCGYICPSHVLPLTEPGAIKLAMKSLFNPDAPFRVKPRWSPALWNWMLQFGRRCNHRQMLEAGVGLKAILDLSMSEYRKLVIDEGLACEWKEKGLLYVLRTEQGMNSFADNDRLLTEEFGVSARRFEGGALPELDPALKSGLAGAFLYEGDTHLRPDVLARNWSKRLAEQGVVFHERCALKTLEKADGRITGIVTEHGLMSADHYVFATGAWTAKLGPELACKVPIQCGKGYSVTMTRPERCPTFPMLFPEHKVGVTPFDEGYRLGSMMEFAGYDTSIPAKRIDQLRASAEPYLVEPFTNTIEEEWYGWRPMTWDSLPIIGRTPKLANAWLAAGHNMLGLSLAPATGRLIAELIQGGAPPIDIKAFRPERFM